MSLSALKKSRLEQLNSKIFCFASTMYFHPQNRSSNKVHGYQRAFFFVESPHFYNIAMFTWYNLFY